MPRPIAYKPYLYALEFATGIESRSSGEDFEVVVEKGKIMDENGDFSLVRKTLNSENSPSCYIMWECDSIGYAHLYDCAGFFISTSEFLPVCTTNIESVTFANSVEDTIVGAYLTIRDVTISSGASVNFNGIKEVSIKPPFHAETGSTVSIRSYTPALPSKLYKTRTSTLETSETTEIAFSLKGQSDKSNLLDLYIPVEVSSAAILIQSIDKQVSKQLIIKDRGVYQMNLNMQNLAAGIYVCSLIADNKLVLTKKIIVE